MPVDIINTSWQPLHTVDLKLKSFFYIEIITHALMTIKLNKKHLKIQKTQYLSRSHV